MRILFLSRWFPYPPINGSKRRIFNLLRALSRQHEVTLLTFADEASVDPVPELTSVCRTVEVVRAEAFRPHSWGAWAGVFRATPRSVASTYSEAMARRIGALMSANQFDLIIASQLQAAGYVTCCAGVPTLFEEVELSVLHEQFAHAPTIMQRSRYALTWSKHRRYVAQLLRSFRACTVVSSREQELLARTVPQHPPITVIPNGVAMADYESVDAIPRANQLIFAGSFRYAANYDAMEWFVENVYPLIHAQLPDTQLTITGDAAGRRLPPAPNIACTGHIEDVRPLVAAASISLAPMRSGGGTRLKILEAMALGTPVVATSKGAEGLEVIDGMHLLIADSPQRFGEHVVRLMRDADLRARLSQNARQLVTRHYNWNEIGARFAQLAVETARQGTAL